MELAKRSNISGILTSQTFAITDSKYGTTGDIHRCKRCGFMQCSKLDDVLKFYEDLKDASYEHGRAERAIQAKRLLRVVQKYRPKGRLLDIGTGSGILVEQAIKMGYDAEGIEPSKWLQGQAEKHGLPVYLGTFPHPELRGPYDVVTVIDVIEHVCRPVSLLSSVRDVVCRDGIVIVVTPNVDSLMARILGWKWWHFRVAHIGYFNRKTLAMALDKAGFRLVSMKRPTWYFTAEYLFERVMTYLPRFLRMPAPSFFREIVIPLNLGDSLLGIYSLKQEQE
ncbi:MAG: class I SAM-dependent methyltransferase [Sedimentisphaerales bacterium]